MQNKLVDTTERARNAANSDNRSQQIGTDRRYFADAFAARRYRYSCRYTVAQIQQQLQIQIFFPAACALYIIRRHATLTQAEAATATATVAAATNATRHSECVLFMRWSFQRWLFLLFFFTFFVLFLLPCVDSSVTPVSPVSLSRLSHVLFINLAKNAARIRPVAAIF